MTAALFVLGNVTIAPRIHAWKAARDIDALLRDDPFYSVILADHPAVREPLRAGLLKAVQSSNPSEAATQVGASVLGPIFPAYIPRASDQALVQFTAKMVATLMAIRQQDPNRCYGFLYPARGPVTAVRNEEGAEGLLRALQMVVTSSRSHAPPIPKEEAVSAALQVVFATLASKYGDDIQLLQHADGVGVDRAKVCSLTIDLFEEIGRLPPESQAPLLRFLYSQS